MSNNNLTHVIIDSIPSTNQGVVEIFSALLVPTIALVGLYIAIQQYRINKQRLRHETYERRLAVYKVVQRYLSEILRDARSSYDRALQFNTEASEAAFLFDESVQNKIDEIYQKSLDMVYNYELMSPSDGTNGLPKGDERTEAAKKHTELLKWHIEQLKESRPFFAKKLGLKIS